MLARPGCGAVTSGAGDPIPDGYGSEMGLAPQLAMGKSQAGSKAVCGHDIGNSLVTTWVTLCRAKNRGGSELEKGGNHGVGTQELD